MHACIQYAVDVHVVTMQRDWYYVIQLYLFDVWKYMYLYALHNHTI